MPEKIEQTRKSLSSQKMGFNQMRNLIYWLQRLMKRYNLSDIELKQRLIDMGKNIGATYIKTITFNDTENLIDLIKDIYKKTIHSKVKINQDGKIITIQDKKCPLCKYEYEDIDVAGCNITIGMIGEMLNNIGYNVQKMEVIQSKAHGDNICIHQYKIIQEDI